jgi:hypothetical protein
VRPTEGSQTHQRRLLGRGSSSKYFGLRLPGTTLAGHRVRAARAPAAMDVHSHEVGKGALVDPRGCGGAHDGGAGRNRFAACCSRHSARLRGWRDHYSAVSSGRAHSAPHFGYLFRCRIRAQFRANIVNSCGQVKISFAATAEPGPGQAITKAVTVSARPCRRCHFSGVRIIAIVGSHGKVVAERCEKEDM